MANESAALADWLEALPLPAFIVSADGSFLHANTHAQPLAARVRSGALPEAFRTAIIRTTEGSSTRFSGDEMPAQWGNLRSAWVSPLMGHALLMLDAAQEPATSYTALSSTMAAMLAHEIRNPLLSIKGAAQLLGGSASAEDAPLAQLIVNEVARIDQLITTLDPLAPAPHAAMEILNVHEVLEHALLATQSAIASAITFDKQYDPSLPEIRGNRDALMQALVNLMKNACEAAELVAMPRVTLSTRYAVGDNRRNAAGQKLGVAISVADNGRGVPPAFVPNLFAPFATTKTSGRGLGLAIVARIAEEHGGLCLYDAPGNGGARFTLYLPIAGSGATPA